MRGLVNTFWLSDRAGFGAQKIASWDMYESFAHRGRAFCAAVLATDEKQ